MIAEFSDYVPKYCRYTGGFCGKLFRIVASIVVETIYKKYIGEEYTAICIGKN